MSVWKYNVHTDEAIEAPDGDWVLSSDYDALESENAKLKALLEEAVMWLEFADDQVNVRSIIQRLKEAMK